TSIYTSQTYMARSPELSHLHSPPTRRSSELSGQLEREKGENTGDYVITQGSLALTDNYQVNFQPGTLTITPLQINVTAEDKSKTYGTDDPELTYIFVPQLIGDDTFSGQLEREKGEHTGDYVITQGSLALSDNYSIAFETGTFTIVPADYKGISFGNASFVYDGVEHRLELTGELPEGVTVSYSIDGKAGNTAVDAGSYE